MNERLKNIIHTVTVGILDTLFPPSCVLCGATSSWLCNACVQGIGDPIRRNDCAVIAATTLSRPLRRLVHSIKYSGKTAAIDAATTIIIESCAEDIAETLSFYPGASLCVTHIPMTKKRERQRGFNHAELLATSLAKKLGVAHQHCLIKTTHHQPLANTRSRREREALIEHSMTGKDVPTNTLILIVDDVVTSGSTLREASRALLEHTRIAPLGVTLAHTPLKLIN